MGEEGNHQTLQGEGKVEKVKKGGVFSRVKVSSKEEEDAETERKNKQKKEEEPDDVFSDASDTDYYKVIQSECIGVAIVEQEPVDSGNPEMRMAVLVLLYMEKFAEIFVVFLLTLLAILWGAFYGFVKSILWILIVVVILSLIALVILYRFPWFRRSPGCLMYKMIYLLFLTAVFYILAIHVPILLSFLSCYFALVALGTVAATYITFAFISVTQKHFCHMNAQGLALWVYAMVMPIGVLLVNQPIYVYGGIRQTLDYKHFMINVASGIFTSLPFILETLYIYQRFMGSSNLEEFLNTPGLLPGVVTSMLAKVHDDEVDNGIPEPKVCKF